MHSTHIYTTTYSALGLNPERFRILVQKLAECLPKLMEKTGAEAVAVRGTSGYSVAFAMRMLCDIPFIIARKAGEASHGESISMFHDKGDCRVSKYLFLDDCIATGATFAGVHADLSPANCVAILAYQDLMSYLEELYAPNRLAVFHNPNKRVVNSFGEFTDYYTFDIQENH